MAACSRRSGGEDAIAFRIRGSYIGSNTKQPSLLALVPFYISALFRCSEANGF